MKYRGYIIERTHAPVPGRAHDYSAYDEEWPEKPALFDSSVEDLKEQIDDLYREEGL